MSIFRNYNHVLLIVHFLLHEDGRYEPFDVIVWEQDPKNPKRGAICHYDVEYCKRDATFYYHLSGSGGPFEQEISGIYWAADSAVVIEKPSTFVGEDFNKLNATRRLPELPAGFDLRPDEDALHWLDRLGRDSDTVYCDICNDSIPTEELCAHMWWCQEIGWYEPADGQGDSGCDCEDCKTGRRRRTEAMTRQHEQLLKQRTGPLPLPA